MYSKVQDLDLSTGGNKIEKLKEINQSQSDIWKNHYAVEAVFCVRL